MKKLFGTDGMRGRAGEFPLDAATVYIAARSLGDHLKVLEGARKPLVIIGRDTRESGRWLEASVAAGLRTSGTDLISAGVITTPGVAYLTKTLNADAGIVISASHNPFEDNGIKIFSPAGNKLDEKTERMIEADIYASNEHAPVETELHYSFNASEAERVCALYSDYLVDEVGRDLDMQGLKIVVDCANGAASHIAPGVFERLGAKVTAINNKPDGRNINKDSGSLHLEGLQQAVCDSGAAFGVAFDGDADRALFSDAEGNLVDGDLTLWVLAQFLDESEALKQRTIVATVMSNIGLEKAVTERGWTLLRTDVGDKNVLEKLIATGASLGGEQSGHIILPRIGLAGDGIVTTIMMLKAMQSRGFELDGLTNGFKRYPQTLVNVRVANKTPFDEVPEIMEAARKTELQLDGNGRLLLRYSGTEPLARVMIEGPEQEIVNRLAAELAETIKGSLG